MLSCDEVRPLLPGIETGESAPGDVRDHLASCEACRDEAERVRLDVEEMRGDLASLASSPFLEDAVLDIARETEAEEAQRGPGRRTAIAVSLAAAAVLLVVLLAGQWQERGTEHGEDEPRLETGEDDTQDQGDGREQEDAGPWRLFAGFQMPPSAHEVYRARIQNSPAPRPDPAATKMIVATEKRTSSQAAAWPQLHRRTHHRWVTLGNEMQAVDRHYTMHGVPAPGVVRFGPRLAKRLSAAGVTVNPQMDLFVAAPAAGGPSAYVSAIFDGSYDGSLLIDEPLGRALGLYAYELPGRCTIAGDLSLEAHRATARLTVPKSDFSERLEVQVLGLRGERPDEVAMSPARNAQLYIAGEIPSVVFPRMSMQYTDGRVQPRGRGTTVDPRSQRRPALDLFQGLEGAGLVYDAKRHPVCIVALPRLSVSNQSRTLRMERVTFQGDYEPGSHVAIARVWTGADRRTMRPSGESVCFTTVAEDRSISFVRSVGEHGPLSMRITRPHPEHPLQAATKPELVHLDFDSLLREPEGPIARLAVDKGGQVTIRNHTIALIAKNPDNGQPEVDRAALNALVAEFKRASKKAGWDGTTRSMSPLRLRIIADADAEWMTTQAAFIASAHAGIVKHELLVKKSSRAGLPYLLPRDPGLNSRTRQIRQELRLRFDNGQTLVEILPVEDIELPETPEGGMAVDQRLSDLLDRVIENVRRRLRPKERLQVVISWLPMYGPFLSYGDVQRLMSMLQKAGVDSIAFTRPPMEAEKKRRR